MIPINTKSDDSQSKVSVTNITVSFLLLRQQEITNLGLPSKPYTSSGSSLEISHLTGNDPFSRTSRKTKIFPFSEHLMKRMARCAAVGYGLLP